MRLCSGSDVAVQLLQLREDYEDCGVSAQTPMAPQLTALVLTLGAIYPRIYQLSCRNEE